MNIQSAARQKLNRRDFLKLAGAAGVTIAGGYVLYEYAPWLNYDRQAQEARQALEADTDRARQMRELIRYATLAANGHNAQAWRFAISEDGIDLYPDYSRRLPVVDPDDRELWISLGCGLENLLVAARATGYAAEVVYPDGNDVVRVRLDTDTAQPSPLFEAIPLRQTTRSEYNGQAVESALLDQLVNVPREPGVDLRFISSPVERDMVLDYVNQGNLSQYANKAYLDELVAWLRFNKKEALASGDGLYTPGSGNPEVPRWIGQLFVKGTSPQQQADLDAAKLRSSPHALLITSDSEDKATWVRTGQVHERMALTMTSLDVQSAFLNQPIEVTGLRSEFQTAIGLGEWLPQLLLRFGYGPLLPRSLRRPVETVLRASSESLTLEGLWHG